MQSAAVVISLAKGRNVRRKHLQPVEMLVDQLWYIGRNGEHLCTIIITMVL